MQCPLCRILQAVLQPPAYAALQLQGPALVTGGLGSLGLLVATWLAQTNHPAEPQLMLVGRSGRADDSALAQSLYKESRGNLQLSRCDITSAEEVSSLLQEGHKVSVYCTQQIQESSPEDTF